MNVFKARLLSKFYYLDIPILEKNKLYNEVVKEYDKALKEVFKVPNLGIIQPNTIQKIFTD